MSTKNRHFIEILQKKYKLLLRCVDPSDELLGDLRSVDLICDHVTEIQVMETDAEKVNGLLRTLLKLSDRPNGNIMGGFVAALKADRQVHVVNIFQNLSNKSTTMSDEHYNVLCDKTEELRQVLEPRDGLLDRMVRDGVFTRVDRRKIIASSKKRDVDEMVQKTIDILQRKPDDAFETFITSLNETGQDHVVRVLTGTGRPPMSPEHRQLLLTKTEELRKYLDPLNGVLDKLVSAQVISEHDDKRIRGASDCTRKLLATLRRKSDDAFHALIKALNETQQEHVTYILTGEGSSRPVSEEFRRRLAETRSKLINTIDSHCTGLISALITKGVFTDDDHKRVVKQKAEPEISRNERILDLIACKSQESFVNFIAALIETGQQHVSVAIIGAKVLAKTIEHCEHENQNHDAQIAHNFDTELLQYIRRLVEDSDKHTINKLKHYLSEKGITVLDVTEGCVEITFTCKDSSSLAELQKLITSGKLSSLFSETFCARFADRGLTSLTVSIADTEFDRCSNALRDLKLMTSEHHQTLKSSAEWLLDELTVSDDLLDKLSLFGERRQAIKRAATREDQVKTLINVVSRQPDSAFARLLNALDDTQQSSAADKLRQRSVFGMNDAYLRKFC